MLKTFFIQPETQIDFSELPTEFELEDHLGGFDRHYRNPVLDKINAMGKKYVIHYHNVLDTKVHQNYDNLTIKFSAALQDKKNFSIFDRVDLDYIESDFEHFLCCFSGSEHVSRQFLVSALHKFGWFDFDTCSKMFKTTVDRVDGNISAFFTDPEQERLYRKFVLTDSEEFLNLQHGFGYTRYDHVGNVTTLHRITEKSFIQIVSETMGTSSCVYITEKLMYPIVSKVLFLTYGQAHYHSHLETYYGFKKYSKIFDYNFDSIENPVIRLVTMLSMLAKFDKLSMTDLHDLYLLEKDTIEHNYDWFRSKQYIKYMSQYAG